MSNRKFSLDLLAILFGISAWISINGVWVELPLLVQVLPEEWKLPSYLSLIVQIANLGPIAYSLFRWLVPNRTKPSFIITILLMVGTLASLLLGSFWNVTSSIFGASRSSALFGLVFCLSLVDCTSSVLFMPFMAKFRETYLNSYLIGEGLSGFLPSVVALIQGVGGNPECKNITTEINGTVNTTLEKVTPNPHFSVSIFFYFIFLMMVFSLVAFILMNCLSRFKREQVQVETDRVEEENSSFMDYPKHLTLKLRFSNESLDSKSDDCKAKMTILLIIQAYVCFISNGVFPSIATYTSLPYGNPVYHLSATLHAMTNPLMAFFAFFVKCDAIRPIVLMVVVGTGFAGFLLANALFSPNMILGQNIGGSLTVISWVIYSALFSYVKISIAGYCRNISEKSLFWCGVVTQLGSALGALLMFLLVNFVTNVFVKYQVEC